MSEEIGPHNGQDNSTGNEDVDEAYLERIFSKIADQWGDEAARAVRLIVERNLRSGRIQAALTQLDNLTLEEYVRRVADRYQNCGPYLVGTPEQRQSYRWDALFPTLLQWAYNWYLSRGFTEPVARDRASASARQAALLIAGQTFPYDTEFDVWAITLLCQACAGRKRQGNQS
jgi:hypothetical protein